MRYLNQQDIYDIGIDWEKSINAIEKAVHALHAEDFAQPIKPYLQYKDPSNRIIAMPAYVGGDFDIAGIKWIASFPNNIQQGVPRAHSVTILNDANNGVPLAVINTALVSGIRTASVSGVMIKQFDQVRGFASDLTLGIVGFGPIGQLHLQMAAAVLGDRIGKIRLYDLMGIREEFIPSELRDKVEICHSWEDTYRDADLFITCTVSKAGYIDQAPKRNALLLNVSLRDFQPAILDHTGSIVVDNWEEVCRANTDIEAMHNQRGLQKEQTKSISEVVCANALASFPEGEAILFNPMGMAIFDVTIAALYYQQAIEREIGTELPA